MEDKNNSLDEIHDEKSRLLNDGGCDIQKPKWLQAFGVLLGLLSALGFSASAAFAQGLQVSIFF